MSEWDPETAAAYDALGEQAHHGVIARRLHRLVGDVTGLRVLDFGCGPGRLSMDLLDAGAAFVHGVDANDTMIDASRRLAAARRVGDDRARFDPGDERALPRDGSYDAALCSLMLMMCATRDRLNAATAALIDSVRPGGAVGIVITHPCFRDSDYGAFRYRMPTGYRYMQGGLPYTVVLEGGSASDESAEIVDYHWALSDYCSAITSTGAAIAGLDEWAAGYDESGEPIGDPAFVAITARRV